MSKELLGSLELNRVYQMDCIEGMKLVPNKSIDMILCDLPYGTTQNKWDTILPLEQLWEQYERIIKNDGAIVLTASQPFTSRLIMSNLKLYKYNWYWEKDTPTNFLNANYQPLKKHEDICVFSKGNASWAGRNKSMKYFPQGLIPYGKVNKRGSSGENYMHSGTKNIQKFTNYPTTKLYYKADSKKLHPTQKPVALFEYLIKTYTNEGEIVLDNCMGSGTTAVAAIKTNRRFIGFETEAKYIEIANKRLQDLVGGYK